MDRCPTTKGDLIAQRQMIRAGPSALRLAMLVHEAAVAGRHAVAPAVVVELLHLLALNGIREKTG